MILPLFEKKNNSAKWNEDYTKERTNLYRPMKKVMYIGKKFASLH